MSWDNSMAVCLFILVLGLNPGPSTHWASTLPMGHVPNPFESLLWSPGCLSPVILLPSFCLDKTYSAVSHQKPEEGVQTVWILHLQHLLL